LSQGHRRRSLRCPPNPCYGVAFPQLIVAQVGRASDPLRVLQLDRERTHGVGHARSRSRVQSELCERNRRLTAERPSRRTHHRLLRRSRSDGKTG
jgi:hypothetical protein